MKTSMKWPAGCETFLTPVIQGEFQVSGDPTISFSTVLGSCASVCMYDELAQVGGMNHYLLANGSNQGTASLKYGAHAMELLINNLLKQGASRSRLKAKVFGGGLMSGRFDYIGPSNTAFALDFLSTEGFPVVAKGIGGTSARRVNFHPTTGQARVISVAASEEPVVAAAPKPAPARPAESSFTLF